MKIVVNVAHKSIPRGITFEVPRFCVLTGKNGSGKSHLLEAIANPSVARTQIEGVMATRIQHVAFNGLNPQVDEQCDSNQVLNNIRNVWNQVNNVVENYKRALGQGEQIQDPITEFLPRFGSNPSLLAIVKQVLSRSGKRLEEITEDDVLNNINFVDITQNQLFFSQCAMIFKAYHTRQIKNEFSEFRAAKYGCPTMPFLSAADFIRKYGPPPWQLINDILKRAGLPYEVTSPEIGDFELPYRLRLIDKERKVDISVNDLSSGEKVLMSLALAIYNTQEGGAKPELLLLDEPDAPLHPQYAKLLIETVKDVIVEQAGVCVIITTHSPATVAMSPDNAVYEIDGDTKVPTMVSNSRAVETLTDGISYLRVSYERRRQVFVESKYDVQFYQRLYYLLDRRHKFIYQPVFLEPHSQASNCTDVISIVKRLCESGSDMVWGLIDFDTANKSEERISVVGNGSRYAIENYLLDPIYVSLALIRYGKKTFSDFGVSSRGAYTDAVNLLPQECQTIVENFLTTIGLPFTEVRPTTLENGSIIQYPQSFLLCNGHAYETLIQQKFIELNAVTKGQGDAALKLGVLQVIEEFPQFLASEIADTFALILGPQQL